MNDLLLDDYLTHEEMLRLDSLYCLEDQGDEWVQNQINQLLKLAYDRYDVASAKHHFNEQTKETES